jgi:hypothetical protein
MSQEMFACALLAFAGLLFLHAVNNRLTFWLKALYSLTLVGSLCCYLNQAYLHPIISKDPAYVEKYGDYTVSAYFHWHEVAHYYLGAKYFKELGYKGLYEAIIVADRETGEPAITSDDMRSLRAPTYWIPMDEAIRRGETEFRPRFTDERWEAFKEDWIALKNLAVDEFANDMVFDAGYNPPPTWAIFGTTVANLLPITEDKAWLGDMRPDWYQALWVGWIDVVMIIAALGVVYWGFGIYGATGFFIMFCTSHVAHYGWISGSFFRYTWLCELMVAAAMLNREKWTWAGVFFALSAVDRIFPMAFFGAAGLALLWPAIAQRKLTRPLLQFSLGALVTFIVMISISLALFGVESWVGFYEKIVAHKNILFMHSVGYLRIAVFGPELLDQQFGGAEGLERMRAWIQLMHDKWADVRWLHMPFLVLLFAAAFIGSLRIKPAETSMMLGSIVFFVVQEVTAYYYIYYPLILTVLTAAPRTLTRDLIMLTSFIALAATWAAVWTSYDGVIINYYTCLSYLVFFSFWAFGRAAESILYYQSWRESRKAA